MLAVALIGMAGAANYMYEKASVKGVGYKNVEMIISTQTGFNGQKLVEKESGSGNVITERTELEAERQLNRDYTAIGFLGLDETDNPLYMCKWPTGSAGNACPMDYINFTKEAEFEYMPVSYQTGTYDQKWVEKLCVQNYRIGAVLTEMYTHAEHLQKTTEVKTRGYGVNVIDVDPGEEGTPGTPDQQVFIETGKVKLWVPVFWNGEPFNQQSYANVQELIADGIEFYYFDQYKPNDLPGGPSNWNAYPNVPDGYYETIPGTPGTPGTPASPIFGANGCPPCCTGVLEANLNSNVIGVAHIGWLSRDPQADPQLKGRHAEYGRSIEDLTGVFSIEKFIQLWGNSTCGAISVDWLPCV